jgi:hypothetical protein
MYKVQDLVVFNNTAHPVKVRVALYPHVENTFMSHQFHQEQKFEPIKLALPQHLLLKCLYKARMRGHVCVLG